VVVVVPCLEFEHLYLYSSEAAAKCRWHENVVLCTSGSSTSDTSQHDSTRCNCALPPERRKTGLRINPRSRTTNELNITRIR